MRVGSLAILIVLGLSLPVVASTPPAYDDSDEAWSTVVDLRSARLVLETALEREPMSFELSEWTPLKKISANVPKLYQARIPTRDGWGRDFLVGYLDGEFAFLSRGENGAIDTVGFGNESEGDPERFGDDMILLRDAKKVINAPLTLAGRQAQTMAHLRSIGTAIETYALDNDIYPELHSELQTLEGLAGLVEPIYIRKLPLEDGWGNPLVVWSSSHGYIVASPGADGVFSTNWERVNLENVPSGGETEDPSADVVFHLGQFVQWPKIRSP